MNCLNCCNFDTDMTLTLVKWPKISHNTNIQGSLEEPTMLNSYCNENHKSGLGFFPHVTSFAKLGKFLLGNNTLSYFCVTNNLC